MVKKILLVLLKERMAGLILVKNTIQMVRRKGKLNLIHWAKLPGRQFTTLKTGESDQEANGKIITKSESGKITTKRGI